MTKRTLVLDVNETLLDLGALAPLFEPTLGGAESMRQWFLQVLLYSNTATLAGPYQNFGQIAALALDMLARSRGLTLPAAERQAILEGLTQLPAHPEVPDALRRLRRAGFRLITLTNSSEAAVGTQLRSSGLRDLVDGSYSVDAVRRFKPAIEVYRYLEDQVVAGPGELMLVAAHPWDCIGAIRAGWSAAFVQRPGKAWFELLPQPQIVGRNFAEVAERIIAKEA